MSWLDYYRLRSFLRRSLWVFPMLGMLSAPIVVRIVYRLDLHTGAQWHMDPDNVRNVLGTLAASMFTVIVFVSSALLLAMQMASTQMTPRIIQLALCDPIMKWALTIFVFTFSYALGVLVRVTTFTPLITTVIALASCITSMGLFLLLVDKVSTFIRPSGALALVALRGRRVIEDVYRHKLGSETHPSEPVDYRSLSLDRTISNPRSGVVLALNIQGIAALAERYDCIIEMVPQVGDFIAAEEPLFRIYGRCDALSDKALLESVALGQERSFEQDACFAFRVIVDIASKALSPAINDPTTAVLALDQLHRLLRNVGSRDLDEGRIHDAAGRLRFVYRTPEWEDFVHLSVTEIRHFGGLSIQIARRMRAMLENLVQTLPPERAALLQLELELLKRSSQRFFIEPEDQALASVSDFQGVGGAFYGGAPAANSAPRAN